MESLIRSRNYISSCGLTNVNEKYTVGLSTFREHGGGRLYESDPIALLKGSDFICVLNDKAKFAEGKGLGEHSKQREWPLQI